MAVKDLSAAALISIKWLPFNSKSSTSSSKRPKMEHYRLNQEVCRDMSNIISSNELPIFN
jgi:hypothetical protein